MALIEQNPLTDLPGEQNPEAAANVGKEMADKNATFTSKGAILIPSSFSDGSEATSPVSPSVSVFTIQPREDAAVTTGEGTFVSKKRKEAAGSSNGPHGGEKRRMPKEDELAILRGMTEFMSVNGAKPRGGKLHKFLKKHIKLSFELSRAQMSDKIYRLRKKYEANVNFFGANVINPFFKKPHEPIAFDLSKKIWGPEAELLRQPQKSKAKAGTLGSAPKPKTKSKKGKEIVVQPSFRVEKGKATELGLGEGVAGELECNSSRASALNSEKDDSFHDVKKLITERMQSHGNRIPEELKVKWDVLQEEEIEFKFKKIGFEKKMHEFALDLLRSSRARK